MNKKMMTQFNKQEIIWNIVNSLLVGAISFFSAFVASGDITIKTFCIAFFVSAGVALIQFKNYWDSEKGEYCPKLFNIMKV